VLSERSYVISRIVRGPKFVLSFDFLWRLKGELQAQIGQQVERYVEIDFFNLSIKNPTQFLT